MEEGVHTYNEGSSRLGRVAPTTTRAREVKALPLGAASNSQLLFWHHITRALAGRARGHAPGQFGDVLWDKPRRRHPPEGGEEARKHPPLVRWSPGAPCSGPALSHISCAETDAI